MRLLIILPSTLRGGAEEYTLKVTSAALKEGWEVYVAFSKTNDTVSLIQDFTAKGIHYHRLEIAEKNTHKLTAVGKHFLRFTQTVALLLKLKPDVAQIIVPWPDQCFGSILACGLLSIPTVVRFALVPYYFQFSRNKLKAYTWARARNQQWITVSENNRSLVCQSFQIPHDQVLCIYNGTKLAPVLSINRSEENLSPLQWQVRHELGISETTQVILTVARLVLSKGYGDLVSVIPQIVREFPNVKFVWVGEGQDKEYLINRIREENIEDKVLFLGYRSDVPRLLKAADLFVFPTHYEGHSNALIEAMAYGLPIVASSASSIPEVIEDQIHGLLFNTKDSRDLLQAVCWALRHPQFMQEMRRRAQLRAQSFSEERMIQKYLELWGRMSRAS